MLRLMQTGTTRRRLAESWIGRTAGVILALLWVGSMSAVDGHAYSAAPFLVGLACVALLFALGLLFGQRIARLTPVAWFGLAAGGYFLLRALGSYSWVESWSEQALLLGCLVFYVAGICVGQLRGSRGLAWVLAIALAVNAFYFFLMRQPGADIIWSGRPAMSLTGPNTHPTSLYLYKNFAGLFFLLGGGLLFWRSVWLGGGALKRWFGGLFGMLCLLLAFRCQTRAVWFLLPIICVGGWILWIIIRLYNRDRLGWFTLLTGLGIFTAMGILLYDFFFAGALMEELTNLDTHLRYQVWGEICKRGADIPLCGFGARATQWEIVPWYNEWQTPNFAHNEYLQGWMDYGPVGVGLMLLFLLLHLVHGFLALASEGVDTSRRIKTALAMLTLIGLCLCSGADFVWHDFSLATLTAFSCGLLAAPYPHPRFSLANLYRHWEQGRGPSLCPVRAQGIGGRLLLVLLAGGFIWFSLGLARTLQPAWSAQWEYERLMRSHAPSAQKLALLERVLPSYPDTGIMDYYVTLPPAGEPDWSHLEQLLRLTHRANPKQLFTVLMLADVMDKQGRCLDVERMLRRCYPGDGPDDTRLSKWVSYYCINLLQWAQQTMSAGDAAAAHSMMACAREIARHGSVMPSTVYRQGIRSWDEGGSPARRLFVKNCWMDLDVLEALGVPRDDSWQNPLEPGGKPSLYRRWYASPASPERATEGGTP